MTSRIGVFLACAAVVLAADQATKALAASYLYLGRPVEVPMDVIILSVGMEPSEGTIYLGGRDVSRIRIQSGARQMRSADRGASGLKALGNSSV